ncbi:hypothetical protein [Parvibaculum sp.]|uniref:hypothetical protein n=1 Tax=Parvibaculum sp. TaxID=2024848 RepID=UPI00273411A4|nr:hypothetical protein [Parvibaculum sp.]MDP3327208.1 hypothetical protein [Parvibaculum sp.]
MAIPTFMPQISVVLKKNIGRGTVAGTIAASERFKGTAREIDLTPYLWESGPVVVDKSVRQPAGMFSITLGDKMAAGEFESLYGLIEPMDVIEIRMARNTSKYLGAGFKKNMPIKMRGFVTRIGRDEVMGESGPTRAIIVTGHDYGKILQIMQIAYLPNEVTGQRLLTYFKFFENYGIGAEPDKPSSAFVEEVVREVLNPFLADMRAAATKSDVSSGVSPVLDIIADASVTKGVISPFGTNQWPGGTIYDMLTHYGDVGPWNEMFVEDREDAPYLVYRPNPFKDPSGTLIQEMRKAPASVTVYDEEVAVLSVARDDAAVSNYYWVNAQSYSLIGDPMLRVAAANSQPAASFYLADYPNSSPFLYGFRRMEVQTQQGPRIDGQAEAVFESGQASGLEFISDRRAILVANNRDNVVFESGFSRIRGREDMNPGMTMKLVRGTDAVGAARGEGVTSEFYVPAVRQEFVPFHGYTTTLTLERGTGFIERVQRDGGANPPYLSEKRMGGVYA